MESVLTVKQRFGIIGDNPKLNRAIEKSNLAIGFFCHFAMVVHHQ